MNLSGENIYLNNVRQQEIKDQVYGEKRQGQNYGKQCTFCYKMNHTTEEYDSM